MDSFMQLDRFDIAILGELRKDARISWSALGEKVSLSAPAAQRRVQAMQRSGVIQYFTAILDTRAMGAAVKAFIQVKIARHDQDAADQFRNTIALYEEVESCYQITGNMDFILIVNARDIESLGDFLENKILYLPSVTDAISSIVLRSLKEHGFI